MKLYEALSTLGCKKDEHGYLNHEDLFYEELWSLIHNGLFDFCCCGDAEYELLKFREVLLSLEERKRLSDEYQIYLYILDKEKFTEHGCSVFGSWLTDRGKALLVLLEMWYVNEYLPDQSE